MIWLNSWFRDYVWNVPGFTGQEWLISFYFFFFFWYHFTLSFLKFYFFVFIYKVFGRRTRLHCLVLYSQYGFDLPFYKKQFTLEKLNSCPHSILFVPRAQQVCSFSLACYCMFLFYFWTQRLHLSPTVPFRFSSLIFHHSLLYV